MSMAPSSPPPEGANAQVPSWRLLATLGVAGALAGLLIVSVFQWATPRVEKHKAALLAEAIEDVLHAPSRADTLFDVAGRLTTEPAPALRKSAERLYRGFDANGRSLGYAITWTETGFSDPVTLIFGYDPATKSVTGLRILSNKETPGLGDKIEKDSTFGQQFPGRVVPLRGVKGSVAAGDKSSIVMITGATISSRTVIRMINNAVRRWEPLFASAPAPAAPVAQAAPLPATAAGEGRP
ncbi:MAG: FMN-binding protein [Gemmatimonadaceae bacterium]